MTASAACQPLWVIPAGTSGLGLCPQSIQRIRGSDDYCRPREPDEHDADEAPPHQGQFASVFGEDWDAELAEGGEGGEGSGASSSRRRKQKRKGRPHPAGQSVEEPEFTAAVEDEEVFVSGEATSASHR